MIRNYLYLNNLVVVLPNYTKLIKLCIKKYKLKEICNKIKKTKYAFILRIKLQNSVLVNVFVSYSAIFAIV